jgi:hypothetical protein
MTTGESGTPRTPVGPSRRLLFVLSWLWVCLPMAYGLYELISKAAQLFTGA